MARPSLIENEQTVQAILEAVRAGVPPSTAAIAAGVKESTYLEWMQRARGTHRRGGGQRFVEFAEALRAAEAEFRRRAQITHTGLALGRTVKREVIRTVINEQGAHEQVVEREYYPPNALALQWALERRGGPEYSPVPTRDVVEDVTAGGPVDADPTATRQDLDRILDRYASAPAAAGGAGPGDDPPGGGD